MLFTSCMHVVHVHYCCEFYLFKRLERSCVDGLVENFRGHVADCAYTGIGCTNINLIAVAEKEIWSLSTTCFRKPQTSLTETWSFNQTF